LGNVLGTINDRKTPQFKTTGNAPNTVTTFSYFKASILSATDYYPFGMTMPGRQVSADKYRYGFNGMEQDKNINSGALDFGARIYDRRIGRWLSVDPLQKKFTGWSPYNSAMNSPLKLKDVDGKDVGVTIEGNCITFSSTIYVIGTGNSDIATKATAAFNTLQEGALCNRTYKHTDGNTYELQFKVHYVAVDPENTNDPNYAAYHETKKAKVGTNGNNIISVEGKGSENLRLIDGERKRSNAGHGASLDYNSKIVPINRKASGVEQFSRVAAEVNVTGNKAYVYNKDDGATAVHETFHLFGLGDRYIESMTLYYNWKKDGKIVSEMLSNQRWHQKGFAIDLMTNNSLTHFSQTHVANLTKAALKKKAATGTNTFVIGQNVDASDNTQTSNADPSRGPYSTTPLTKKP
jgi:RHS repeat-associated protein